MQTMTLKKTTPYVAHIAAGKYYKSQRPVVMLIQVEVGCHETDRKKLSLLQFSIHLHEFTKPYSYTILNQCSS